MKQVCILVKFSRDAEKNTYSWIYTGGCYKDNQAVWYEDASPGDVEDFKNVQFEVRMDQRDFSEISEDLKAQNANNDDDDESTDVFEDEDISTQSVNGQNKTEKPADRIRRERSEYLEKAANGEIKPEGTYLFY
jgi:hypothetical protein